MSICRAFKVFTSSLFAAPVFLSPRGAASLQLFLSFPVLCGPFVVSVSVDYLRGHAWEKSEWVQVHSSISQCGPFFHIFDT